MLQAEYPIWNAPSLMPHLEYPMRNTPTGIHPKSPTQNTTPGMHPQYPTRNAPPWMHMEWPIWNALFGMLHPECCEYPIANLRHSIFRCAALILLYGTDGCTPTELDSFSNMTIRFLRYLSVIVFAITYICTCLFWLPPLQHLMTTSSNGRYYAVQCRKAAKGVTDLLKSWTEFCLLESSSYIRFLRDEKDHPYSFYVIRVTSKPPCFVVWLAFLGGTPGSLRHSIYVSYLIFTWE